MMHEVISPVTDMLAEGFHARSDEDISTIVAEMTITARQDIEGACMSWGDHPILGSVLAVVAFAGASYLFKPFV
jgi:hypothetical protein